MHAGVNAHHELASILESTLKHAVTEPYNKSMKTIVIQPHIYNFSTFTAFVYSFTLKQLAKYFQLHPQIFLKLIFLFIDMDYLPIGSNIGKFILEVVKQFKIRPIIKSNCKQPIACLIEQAVLGKLPILYDPFVNVATIVTFTLVTKTTDFLYWLIHAMCNRIYLLIVEFDLFLLIVWGLLTLQHKMEFIIVLCVFVYSCLFVSLYETESWLTNQARQRNRLRNIEADKEIMLQQLFYWTSLSWVELQHFGYKRFAILGKISPLKVVFAFKLTAN